MSIDKFRELSGQTHNIAEMLVMPEVADIDFEIERTQDVPRLPDSTPGHAQRQGF